MSAPSRFPKGLTNSSPASAMGMLGIPDPTKFHTFMDDFDNYTAGDWVITTTEAGAGSATEAVGNLDGGILVLTNAAGDNDNDFLQYSGNTGAGVAETFLFESGKKLFFKSRLKVSDATQSDFVMGLQITDTTPLGVTDGVFFRKSDGAATLDVLSEKNSVGSAASGIHTFVDDTYTSIAFYYNGDDKIEVFVNDVKVTTLATTNLPDDEELTISFGHQNGEAVAKIMSVDYIFVAKER